MGNFPLSLLNIFRRNFSGKAFFAFGTIGDGIKPSFDKQYGTSNTPKTDKIWIIQRRTTTGKCTLLFF